MTFAWSYSRLKNFESCALKYKTVDIDKLETESTQELARGEQLHNAMYERVAKGTKLPAPFAYMEKWALKLTKDVHPQQEMHCELKLAIDDDYQPTEFMGKRVWCRSRIDYVKVIPKQAHVVDYKTGRPRQDDTQLALSAAMIMYHYPEVMWVRAEYIWTEYGDTDHQIFTRENLRNIWNVLLPRVIKLREAHEYERFPASPGGLCAKYCPVSTCEFWGKRVRREASTGATVSW